MSRKAVKEVKETKSNEHHTLYDLLNIKKEATKEEIRKAYKLLAAKIHPDKNQSEDATEHFQNLNKAYNILIDDEKRAYYDQTGKTEDDINIENAYSYYRDIFPKITVEDIEAYKLRYIDSDEEIEDIIDFYNQNKGSMTNLLSWIPFSENTDIVRLVSKIEKLIQDGTLEPFHKFSSTKAKVKKIKQSTEKELNEAKSSLDDIASIIKARQHQRSNLINNQLTDKANEISEEDFLATQAKIIKRKGEDQGKDEFIKVKRKYKK